ncbi:MAG: ABC transporter permease [Thermoanaerobaculia bacterium]
MNVQRVRRMLMKEFIQLRRDPRMRAIIFVVPILQTVIFGYAVTTDVRDVTTALYDQDRTPASRDLIERFTGSGYFTIVEAVESERRAREIVDRSEARVVLHIPEGFQREMLAGRSPELQVIVDGTDSNTAMVVLNYASRIVTRFNQGIRIERIQRLSGQTMNVPLEVRTRAWFNPNLESRNFYVPGVVVLLVTLVTLLLSSMAVVREKEIGTIEQINVTPITQLEFLLGKTLPFVIIAFIDVIIVTLVATLLFSIPIRGSFLLLLVSTALFLMSTIGAGLLISTVSSTQQQAMMTTFFYFFPAILLSGFIFPIANMPVVIQWVTFVNPLRYFLVIVRGIFLKGVGPAVLWPHMVGLFFLGTATLLFVMTRFRKTAA